MDHTILLNPWNENWLNCLQVAQNNATQVVTSARRRDHITPVLRSPHWLPVSGEDQVQGPPCYVTFKVIHSMHSVPPPSYLAALLDPYAQKVLFVQREKISIVSRCGVQDYRSLSTAPQSYCRHGFFFHFLALLDYVSRAHEIAICPSSVIRPSSVRPCRNYF